MPKQCGESGTQGFSHELLDQEAARYCELVSTVQQEFAKNGATTPCGLFALAEQCDREGRSLEAEFVYLHFIHVWEDRCRPVYPINFTGLREYARQLFARAVQVLAEEEQEKLLLAAQEQPAAEQPATVLPEQVFRAAA